MSNEQTFKEFIAEVKTKELAVEWVNWMLDQLENENAKGHAINPAWLRASGRMIGDNEPAMFYTK